MTAEEVAEQAEGEVLADAYNLSIQAEALRAAADDWDALGAPVAESPVARWLRCRADAAEGAAERLEASVPRPDAGGGCRVVEVDGEPVRVHADRPMPSEEREALAELVRAVQARTLVPTKPLHELIRVAAYVSMGRGAARAYSYPDALARTALGGLSDEVLRAALDGAPVTIPREVPREAEKPAGRQVETAAGVDDWADGDGAREQGEGAGRG